MNNDEFEDIQENSMENTPPKLTVKMAKSVYSKTQNNYCFSEDDWECARIENNRIKDIHNYSRSDIPMTGPNITSFNYPGRDTQIFLEHIFGARLPMQ